MTHTLECLDCEARYDPNERVYACPKCGGLLDAKIIDAPEIDLERWAARPIGVWRYHELIPIEDGSSIISIGEGGTGLHPCHRLAGSLGLDWLGVKNEGENPTGSFKDRGMTVGVTKAVELGAEAVICASTGNTSASLAAYAAKAGLKCFVLIPAGKIAGGKLAQAIVYGAKVVEVEGNFDDAMRLVIEITKEDGSPYLLNSINPFRVEGQKTMAYEINDQLGHMPDIIVIPVGNAGNITALWKGLQELKGLGITDKLPRVVGVQAENAAPIATAFKMGLDFISPVAEPETVATAIRIGSPVNWKRALSAARESGGTVEMVSDDEILNAQKALARKEGIFVEPASASTIAGAAKLVGNGFIETSDEVVCITTGNGLKDQGVVMRASDAPVRAKASRGGVMEALGLKKA